MAAASEISDAAETGSSVGDIIRVDTASYKQKFKKYGKLEQKA